MYNRLGLAGAEGGSGNETQLNASATYVRALYVIDKVIELIDSL